MSIEFGPEVCADLSQALSREWLETNGLGGFASSTLAGANTRRYHGLLVASLRPPTERFLLLSKLEETLVLDGGRIDFGTNQYPGAVHPEGYRRLRAFRLAPFPTWTFEAGGFEIEKTVAMLHGENTTVVRYRLLRASEGQSLHLELRPLLAFRGYHSLGRENGYFRPDYEESPGRLSLQPYEGLPPLYLHHNASAVERQGFWYRDFEYTAERDRGLDYTEDLFNPLALHFDLRPGDEAVVIASVDRTVAADAGTLLLVEAERRRTLEAAAPLDHPLVRSLTVAADQFLVRRGAGQTVIAGYPWFTDWGRDTMIALPGLTLATGRPDVARGILLEFSRHVDQGLLPNRFPDAGESAEYNTADATLWYFQAVHALARYTGDYEFIRTHLYPVLVDILDWHLRGTRHGIRMDEDGLLRAGEEGLQLTWMDAKVGDWVVTPRRGKPVEIQALWYNALRVMEDLSNRFGEPERARKYGRLAGRAARSFNARFWDPALGYLYDVLDDAGQGDPSLRPNQVLAVSLPHTMLSREKARSVVETVQRHLLTPFGLRTLSPEDERYAGRYEGDPWHRDSRYHQGTVWPWLMGPFLTAYVRVHGGSAAARRQAAEWLDRFQEHLREAGLGQVSEVLDGDPPHRPGGCPAQAWSVAELLRAAVEDVYPTRGGASAPAAAAPPRSGAARKRS